MVNLIQYKCPQCGGAIEFDPTAQKLKCPFCDTEFIVENLATVHDALNDTPAEDMEWEDKADSVWTDEDGKKMSVYVCQSCGGEVIADETLAATSCPYCGNPVVMKGRLSGDLKPDIVIPFKKTKEDAKAAYLEHLKGKRLLPKVFADQNHIDEIKGLYVPVWLFDSDVEADFAFDGTKTRMWSDSQFNYTETSYYKLLRSGALGFEKIPVDGTSKLDNILMESVEPFNFGDAVDFQTAYLAGYLADRYDVDAKSSESRANERIKTSTEESFYATTAGYSGVMVTNESIRLKNSSYKYALYPIWILNTTWNNEKFTFIMNGQTGKMAGDLPTDTGLLRKWFLILFLIGAGVTFGLAQLFTML